MQLSGFHCGVAEEKSSDEEVIPGAQQLLVLQQNVFIPQKDLGSSGEGEGGAFNKVYTDLQLMHSNKFLWHHVIIESPFACKAYDICVKK